MTHSRRGAGLLLALALTCTASQAEASDSGPEPGFVAAIASATIVPFVLVTTVDIVYAAKNSWLPPGWAVTEIVAGGWYCTLGMMGLVSSTPSPALGSVFLAIGTFMLTHAILSLVRYEREPDVGISVEPNKDGALLRLTGAF